MFEASGDRHDVRLEGSETAALFVEQARALTLARAFIIVLRKNGIISAFETVVEILPGAH